MSGTKLKVRMIGSSKGLILDKNVCALMNLEVGDEIHLSAAPGGGMRLTRYDPDFERQLGIVNTILKEDVNILRALAK
jgi:putative addiction module antidote